MGGSRLIPLPSPKETVSLGKACAKLLPSGSILALFGDLGAGKTTFVQGLASGLSINDPIQSPTFTYLQTYEGTLHLHHFDLYRIKSPSDFFSLGFDEYFTQGITAIEWAERLGKFLPAHTISLHFSYEGKGRTVRITSTLPSKLLDSSFAWV